MRKTKSLVAALAATAGMLLAIPSAASAASVKPALSVYTYTEVDVSLGNLYAEFAVYATYSQTQIWINGKVECGSTQGWVVSWCSNTNNGQAWLNVGMNLVNPYGSWYARNNIYANNSGCSYWGSSQLTLEYWECEVQVGKIPRESLPRPAAAGTQHWVTKTFTFHLPAASLHMPAGALHLAAGSVYRNLQRTGHPAPGMTGLGIRR